MGNAKSSAGTSSTQHEYDDVWWSNGNVRTIAESGWNVDDGTSIVPSFATINSQSIEREQRRKELEEDFAKFKEELAKKHERRRQLIAEKRKEMNDVKEELVKEREETARLRRMLNLKGNDERSAEDHNDALSRAKDENEELKNEIERLNLLLKEKEIISDKNKELRICLADLQGELQALNTQIIGFEKERMDYQEHVVALKDIIRVTKEMLQVREHQINELKKKITTIEELLASKEVSILSDDLRQEYERQLQNIKDLRILYEERQRADVREKENLRSLAEDAKKLFEDEHKKNEELEERIQELEKENSDRYDKIINLESNLGLSRAECKELQAEMGVINQLFSQILISFNSDQEVDLDNLIKILEENHDLLTNIVIRDENNESSALPKLLLDLVNQVNENKKEPIERNDEEAKKLETISEEEAEGDQLPGFHQLNSPEEIVENLPKVWRVLIELLSHQSIPNNEIEKKPNESDSHCYKSVQTPTGLRKVVSVSKTFIRLKNLILEKKFLEKEMTRLKQLNTHLEGRLQDQEKRLVLVTSELSKTWNVVGMMQKQHQQLHTQEKILRYELAQKRKLLTELKEELEYARQKWLQAREQNSSTEKQWKLLRTEFASRKRSVASDDINNSVESGYSDDKSSSEEDVPDSDVEKVEEETNLERANSILEVIQTEVEQIVNSFDTDEFQAENATGGEHSDEKTDENEERQPEEGEIKIGELQNDSELEDSRNKIEENVNDGASTSAGPSQDTPKNPVQAAEEFVARREERMKRLEEQCNELYFSVAKNSLRGLVMSDRLRNLHETYGGSQNESGSSNDEEKMEESQEEATNNVEVTADDVSNAEECPRTNNDVEEENVENFNSG